MSPRDLIGALPFPRSGGDSATDPLVRAAAEGDRDAFGALFDCHRDYAFAVARRLTPDDEAAADLVQEAFLKALTRLHTYRGEAPFRGWLARIVVNTALDHRRRTARTAPLDDDQPASARSIGVEERLDRVRLRERLRSALRTLDPRLRAAFVLRYRDGASYREIGRRLTLPPGTVASRLTRARAAVIAALGRRTR